MKDCNNCRHMYDAGGECACYMCELFGEDIPSALEKGDGCCLHPNEVKKAIRLRDRALSWNYSQYGKTPTEYEKRMIKKTSAEYNEYINHLEEKYKDEKMMENKKLKPCPFCGGEAKSYDDYVGFCHIQCTKCGNGTLKCTTALDAQHLWNKRVPTTHIKNDGHMTINIGGKK